MSLPQSRTASVSLVLQNIGKKIRQRKRYLPASLEGGVVLEVKLCKKLLMSVKTIFSLNDETGSDDVILLHATDRETF